MKKSGMSKYVKVAQNMYEDSIIVVFLMYNG